MTNVAQSLVAAWQAFNSHLAVLATTAGVTPPCPPPCPYVGSDHLMAHDLATRHRQWADEVGKLIEDAIPHPGQ